MPPVNMQQTQQPQLYARFIVHAEPDVAKSKEAGRPIYHEYEAVEISFPGDRGRVFVAPAHQADPNATRLAGKMGTPYQAFPPGQVVTYAMVYSEQYKAFKSGAAQSMEGTPLEELHFLTEAKRRELKALNIYTAETLAALDGKPLQALGLGGRDLKNAAQAYIDDAAAHADQTSLAMENAELKSRLDALEADYQTLIRQIKAGDVEVAQPRAEAAADDGVVDQGAFESWDVDALKAHIEEQTGSRPKGNPSHTTLVRAAYELAGIDVPDSVPALPAKEKEAA